MFQRQSNTRMSIVEDEKKKTRNVTCGTRKKITKKQNEEAHKKHNLCPIISIWTYSFLHKVSGTIFFCNPRRLGGSTWLHEGDVQGRKFLLLSVPIYQYQGLGVTGCWSCMCRTWQRRNGSKDIHTSGTYKWRSTMIERKIMVKTE